jgi:hypothetical protein
MVRLSPTWLDHIQTKIQQTKESGDIFTCTVSNPQAKRAAIHRLVDAGVPFKVIQNGCGVTTITTDTHTCPKCRGTGRC